MWAEHIVFVYPIWWGTMPALLKGWIDRTLLPRFAFKMRKGKLQPEKFLTGKTAEIIKTSGGPRWVYFMPIFNDNGIWRYLITGFTGIKLKKITHFGKITPHTDKKIINKIITKVKKLAK